MKKYHEVQRIEVKNGTLSMVVDGISVSKELKDISSVLATATNAELADFEVSPSGYGIHWPLVDEDISIDVLLGIFYDRER
ncbi:MAG: DUF2442 domain-containing protein [Chlorobaculum sp.]|jgi:hypothetical protein|nr:DUF2442 domain-containing protein [Chlorobaculum sp.]